VVILLGAAAGMGLLLVVVGLTPRPVRERRPDPEAASDSSAAGAAQDVTGRAVSRIGRDLGTNSMLLQDARMVGRDVETHSLYKLVGLGLGAVMVAFSGVLADLLLGLGVPVPVLAAAALAGGLGGFWLPDSMLRTEADKERVLFQQVTESWLELVAQLVTAGADTFGALSQAATHSKQPGFVVIGDALREAAVGGEPPWTGLRKMADERRLPFLDPFCSALQLAGTTGAGSRQAILAQVEAARSKAMQEADAAAASAGEKMGAPLALIGGAFMILMGYPPMASIFDTSSLTGL